MKERFFNLMIIIISIFVLVELLIKKSLIYSSIMLALNLWVNNLIPSLFPFFIISDILINYNIVMYIPKNIKNLCKKVFGINDNLLIVFFLSMIAGFPSNARNTRMLYDKKLITNDEANHILLFTHFANPIFILTTIGVFFLHSEKIGIIILISHYLSNIILGILFRNLFNSSNNKSNNKSDNTLYFGSVFTTAIKRAIDTIIMICGIVVVFLTLSTIVVDTLNLGLYNSMIIRGLFEITIGVQSLSNINISLFNKAIIISCFLAFGGLSVHIQVLSQIVGTNIKYFYFFIGRIYQLILSGIITYFLCLIYKI